MTADTLAKHLELAHSQGLPWTSIATLALELVNIDRAQQTGAIARAYSATLSPEQRKERARKAAVARWARHA